MLTKKGAELAQVTPIMSSLMTQSSN
jgi:hypothetical protein